ncbi:MAG: class I SAM-dependent methyltransferase, partial [Anaerolineae bacterium]|nr:class I SAM-dependent methyltransferase [Anaerolineae bacterium]
MGWQQQTEYVIDQLRKTSVPVVDLASGRGYLVEQVARQLPNYVVATDFSPRVLRRNQALWRHFGLCERVSQIAFDARRTPFKNGAVSVMTSNLGLPNIEQPGDLVRELRRVVAERLLSVMHFFPEDDVTHAGPIREHGLDIMLYARRALAAFGNAGWRVVLENAFTGPASPTPHGDIIPSGVDGLPVADTMLTWAVLVA